MKIAPWRAHDPEVAHRGHQCAMSGRGAEHRGDGRDPARALRLGKQVGRGAAVMPAGGTKAGAFEQHHQRNFVAQRQFGDAVSLGVASRSDAAGHRGEVLGAHHHRRAVDRAGADDDRVGRDLAADEGAEFAERARVEEPLDARAGVELALAAVLVEPLRPAHGQRMLTAAVEVLERLRPIRRFCHASVLPLVADSSRTQTSRVTYWIAYCKVTRMAGSPRLKIDGGIPNRLGTGARGGRATWNEQGYDGGWTAETSHDPFLPLLLAAEHTSRLELGTNIAVAFARNPMIVANIGWDLQAYSKGRFILGLGTQIQPHIEKRFSMPWSHPARRMREFVSALHAIWSAWKDGTKLRFEGEFYTHKIMTPMFTPEPQPYPAPKVFLAAVGEAMTEMCGEVADGHLGHPMVSKRYLDEVTMPALRRGHAALRPRSQRLRGVVRSAR